MTTKQLRLGVNVDHVATLRQARGTSYPDPLEAARLCARAGAHGITVHLREDRRHIQDADVLALAAERVRPLNLELASHPDILRVAVEARPDEACFVPEKREELTTEGGLDVAGQESSLAEAVARLKDAGITVSLFVEAEARQLDAAQRIGATYVELHTGTCCNAAGERRAAEVERLVAGARHAHELELKVNAGHGINRENIASILEVPYLDTLNIGHSIVARAVFVGLEAAVHEMLAAMSLYRGGRTVEAKT